MAGYTLKNLNEVENSASKFSYAAALELHVLLAKPRGDRRTPRGIRCPLRRGRLCALDSGSGRRGQGCRLGRPEQRSGRAGVGPEVAYYFDRAYWGRGLAPELADE